MPLPNLQFYTGDIELTAMIIGLIQWVLIFVGALAVVMIIWGGVQFMLAGGDSDKVTKARNTILYSILGVVVVVLSYALVSWAGTFGNTVPTI